MKKIIQLSEYDYNKLVELANLNQDGINKKAFDIYKERGVCSIKLTLDTKERDYDDEITIVANSYVSDWNNEFPIDEDNKRKIVDFVNERAYKMMKRKYGRQISNIEFYNSEGRKVVMLKHKFILFTIIGWLLAIVTTLVVLIK